MDGNGRDDPVRALVAAALDGDHGSWNRLVERYMPVVLSVVRRFRLQGSDADDVVQTVWLRTVEKLDTVRDPEALPGWLVATTRHECHHLLRARQRVSPSEQAGSGAQDEAPPLESQLLRLERHEALLAALAELPDRQRNVLLVLLEDPPPSYAEVSRRLGLPVGSIGPTRARALARIRASQVMQDFLDTPAN